MIAVEAAKGQETVRNESLCQMSKRNSTALLTHPIKSRIIKVRSARVSADLLQ